MTTEFEVDKATRRKNRISLKATFLAYEGMLVAAKVARAMFLEELRDRHFVEVTKYQGNPKYSKVFQSHKLDRIAENNIIALESYLKISNMEIAKLKRLVRGAHLARAYYFGHPYSRVENKGAYEPVCEADIRSVLWQALGYSIHTAHVVGGLVKWLEAVPTVEKVKAARIKKHEAYRERRRLERLAEVILKKGLGTDVEETLAVVLPKETPTTPFTQTLRAFPAPPEGEE